MAKFKKFIKAIAIISVVLVVVFGGIRLIIKGLWPAPETYVPVDNIKCDQSALALILTHGFPDEIDTTGYDINMRIHFEYNDEEIMGENMDCSYSLVFSPLLPTGALVSATYFSEGEGFSKQTFYDDANEYLQKSFEEGTYTFDETKGFDNETDLWADYSHSGGAIGQNTSVYACDDYGYIRFEWIY